jgi:hypothetical protein
VDRVERTHIQLSVGLGLFVLAALAAGDTLRLGLTGADGLCADVGTATWPVETWRTSGEKASSS